MGIELALIGAAAGVASAALAFAGFWLALGGRIGAVEASADAAKRAIAAADHEAKEAKASVASLQASVQLWREMTIREFVAHDHLNALENRLVESSARTEERLSEQIAGMSKRLDRLIETGLRAADNN